MEVVTSLLQGACDTLLLCGMSRFFSLSLLHLLRRYCFICVIALTVRPLHRLISLLGLMEQVISAWEMGSKARGRIPNNSMKKIRQQQITHGCMYQSTVRCLCYVRSTQPEDVLCRALAGLLEINIQIEIETESPLPAPHVEFL